MAEVFEGCRTYDQVEHRVRQADVDPFAPNESVSVAG